MKIKYMLSVALLTSGMILIAQNFPTIGTPANDTLFVGSGQNFLMIPEVDDGNQGVEQEISFTVTSSDPGVLEISEVLYVAGNAAAIVKVSEKGVTGTVVIQVEATDPDGTSNTSFEVSVVPYSNPGINFEIHDIVFWQQFVPLEANPAFKMIATTGEAPYDQIDLPSLQLSVYSDCKESPPCTGTDFFTAMFRGYLIPPVSGDYYFTMIAGDQSTIGLSTDESFDNARVILYTPENGRVGTNTASYEWKSIKVSLVAGRSYAVYGTQWNIHNLMGGILWEGPGIDRTFIPGENLSHVYDGEKPSVPGDFTLVNTGINDLLIQWSAATDNVNLAGYNVYINGRIVNNEPITQMMYKATDLLPGTTYSLMVTSVDLAGNESAANAMLTTTTYVSDDLSPLPPTTVSASVISDLSFKVIWSGASDGETEIRGFKLYVDGELYNEAELIYVNEALVKGLKPETDYQVELEAVDAAYNVSAKSDPLVITTTNFDPGDNSITDKKARLRVIMDPVGKSDGLGVNPDYETGDFLNDPEQVRLIKELEVSGIRWGGLDANPLSFKDHIGTGKEMTFGNLMDFCNSINAYSIITCGVEDATDWRTNPETFTNFLEYLAGPADSDYGAKRVAEGYQESLLDGSRGLVFEFGNEVWGGVNHEAQIGENYGTYGEWCREMAAIMRASEYYDEDKIYLSYSGRRPVPSDSYGLHESLLEGDQGEVDWLALSGYMGGNLDYAPEVDPGKSELDYYKNGISEMARNLDGLKQTIDLVLKETGEIKPSYFYEANMTHESYFGRLGQALVQTDYYASAVELGGVIPTVFHLTGGQWKMVIPSQDYKKTPLFYTTQLFNRFCKGIALRTEVETNATITNASGDHVGIPPIGCHAYKEGDAFSLLLFSRDYEHDYTVQIDLPDDLAMLAPESAMKYVLSGEGFSAKEASIDSSTVNMSDSLLVLVPKYSMVVISFGGNGINVEDVPLGFYSYVAASSVSIYPYGSEGYDIADRKSKILRTTALPEDVLSGAVKWSVETQGVEVTYGLKSYGFEVNGSGTCEGNGTIIVRASSWDNPEIYDEVEITISGQGSDCELGMVESADDPLRIYPNPAGDILYVDGLPGECESLEVLDVTGRIVQSLKMIGFQADLDLSNLAKGPYYLRINTSRSVITRSFIRK